MPEFDTCPACSFSGIASRADSDICPQCGIVFSKYRSRLNEEVVQQKPAQDILFTPMENVSIFKKVLTDKRTWSVGIAVLIAVWIRFGHDWKLNENYVLQPGNWQGEMTFRGKQHPFMLVIESADDGKLEGYMEWTGTIPRYRLAIRGTHRGNHLLFEDYAFLEGSGQYGLHDKKDAYITNNELTGTDKNGAATLHAVQVATSPDSDMELGKQ